MTLWHSILSIFLCLLFLGLNPVQGQTCNMITRDDMKLSDGASGSFQFFTGISDFAGCAAACLNDNDCNVVEFRSSVCIYVTTRTAGILVDNAGSTSAVKVCSSTDTTVVPPDTTTEDTDPTTQQFDTTTEDNAHTCQPILPLVIFMAVLASVLDRRL